MCEFTHLHVHTDASLRDGLGEVNRLMTHAKSLGFSHLAMTDHGTLANAVTFGIEAKLAGIKPVYGLEGYVEFDGVIGHITLLADGPKGWSSLLALNNLAHESTYRQPAFQIDDLVKHQAGLICMTGCIASPFHQLPYGDAYRLGNKLRGVFGGRLFAELMFVGDSIAWERPLRLASALGLSPVITNDVHFPFKEDGDIHPVLTRMKSGFDYDSTQLYLKAPQEILDAALVYELNEDDVKEMMLRTTRIAERLGAINLASEPRLPSVESTFEDFTEEAANTARGKLLLVLPEYYDRFRYEMGIIQSMGYVDYFIILKDIIDEARRQSVRVGPGRGSGAGSLVLYLMGITDVDPIAHNLQFERFLNPERKGMPDVDVDIESERRDLVLEYAADKYGAVPIATYSRYSHKSLVRDLGKMFRVDKDLIDKAADGGQNSDAFKEIVDDYPKLEACYDAFMNQIRHKGKHAGGVIITDTPVPIERMGGTLGAAWSEGRKNELSYAGIVKFDLLGLSALSALRRLEEEFGYTADQPSDGAEEFSVFQEGDLAGVFQFAGSDGIRQLTIRLQPETLEDLIAINALYRPGAIDAGSTELYPDWKEKPRKVPAYIEDILEPTYGAIVYQEQFMEIFARTVNGSLAEADLARRIITKSKPGDRVWLAKKDKLEREFLTGAIGHGLSHREAAQLWRELETHSRYSFNRSHSAAYAMIAWQCAWWKYHHPAHFYAAFLNTDKQEEQTYIIEALKKGIRIGPPHVNRSGRDWVATGKKLLSMPLSSVKFMGSSGVDALLAEREANGKFNSTEEFMKRVPKRFVRARAREGLWQLGGFSTLDKPDEPDEIAELLGLKETPQKVSRQKTQLKYLGFIVPTRKMLEEYEKLEAVGWTCGIINSMDSRSSKHGPYKVYRLSPNGVFWTRDKHAMTDLDKGMSVGALISEKNGRLKKLQIL
jgi:DNA polymerase-3 subunit alpha